MAWRKATKWSDSRNSNSGNGTNLSFEATLNEELTKSDHFGRAIRENLRGLGFIGYRC